jgi:N-acetylmuramoyl-L-alanine amidase
VVRASNYSGTSIRVAASQQDILLNKFTDANKIVWAQQEIAAAINAGYINGLTDTTIGSNKQATRAESATMLKRFLTRASFIN